MKFMGEFLESSTIHCLVYISKAETAVVKIIWAIVVFVSFVTAGVLISNSYSDWASSPISTSISTHPISSLPFPQVTVCPPKGSNTALNYDMLIVNKTFTTKTSEQLKKIVNNTFMKKDHNQYVSIMTAITNGKNIREIYIGLQTVPFHVGKHGFKMKFSSIDGEIVSPWFGEKVNKRHYQVNCSYDYILEFPDANMANILGPTASLVIELTVNTREEDGGGIQ